jgi:hypothetical protein
MDVTQTPTKDLIQRFKILQTRMDAYVNKVPLRVQSATMEELFEVRDELAMRGLFHAGRGKFVTVPIE